ncbi:MAG: type II/IV secretion system protein [Lentisphaerae bacterium]|nr:type II/IV secretion system protein [Lentisphaerota bacterium]
MCAWTGGWGVPRETAAKSGVFRITKIKVMNGAINAEMFNHVDLKKERQGNPSVAPGANGDELLKAVVDYGFMTDFNKTDNESVSVMTRCGFIPLGVASDGDDSGAETLYVLINERNASLAATPYMPSDVYRNLVAVLADKILRPVSVRLVRVDSSVVNRVIDFIYYRIEIRGEGIDEAEVAKPLSVDVQPGETGVIMQARAWFREALNRGASDIHIEPMDNGVGRIRLRVNGILEILQRRVPIADLVQIVTWVKAQSRMDISERRKPLDGSVRISYTDSGVERLVDVRISTIPVAFGQKMVMRLLDPGRLKKLAKAGLAGTIWDAKLRRQFEEALGTRDGIVLVTGPTGSGKTSTLNVALMHLLSDDVFGDKKNIATIEDPIEYTIPGANQTQTNDAAGVTFAKMLRALLRQDPDIILVGEIRDPETAQIAVQAALTGHLILATLHTNDALGAIDRLKDLGISPFLIGSTLRMTQAQRLVRRLCSRCGKTNQLTGEDLERKVNASRFTEYRDRFLVEMSTVYEPSRCAYCNWSGFDGRIAVMEMAPSSPMLVKAIEKGMSSRQLVEVAMAHGYRPMMQNGVEMICSGLTSIAEMESISLTSISDDEEVKNT